MPCLGTMISTLRTTQSTPPLQPACLAIHPFGCCHCRCREIEATEARLLRSTVGSFYELLGLATRTLERFGPA